jgi:hypothetical protein
VVCVWSEMEGQKMGRCVYIGLCGEVRLKRRMMGMLGWGVHRGAGVEMCVGSGWSYKSNIFTYIRANSNKNNRFSFLCGTLHKIHNPPHSLTLTTNALPIPSWLLAVNSHLLWSCMSFLMLLSTISDWRVVVHVETMLCPTTNNW